jgi:hypothetical protein
MDRVRGQANIVLRVNDTLKISVALSDAKSPEPRSVAEASLNLKPAVGFELRPGFTVGGARRRSRSRSGPRIRRTRKRWPLRERRRQRLVARMMCSTSGRCGPCCALPPPSCSRSATRGRPPVRRSARPRQGRSGGESEAPPVPVAAQSVPKQAATAGGSGSNLPGSS